MSCSSKLSRLAFTLAPSGGGDSARSVRRMQHGHRRITVSVPSVRSPGAPMASSSAPLSVAASLSVELIAAKHVRHTIRGQSIHSSTFSDKSGGRPHALHLVVCPIRDSEPLSLGRNTRRLGTDAAPVVWDLLPSAVGFLFRRGAAVPLRFGSLLELRGTAGETNTNQSAWPIFSQSIPWTPIQCGHFGMFASESSLRDARHGKRASRFVLVFADDQSKGVA